MNLRSIIAIVLSCSTSSLLTSILWFGQIDNPCTLHLPPSTVVAAPKERYAYAFLYYEPNYHPSKEAVIEGCQALVAIHALKRVREEASAASAANNRYYNRELDIDYVIMETSNHVMPNATRRLILDAGVKVVSVSPPSSKGDSSGRHWTHRYLESYAKLRCAEMFQYRRVIFLELDYLALKPLDHLFTAFQERVPYAAPRMYWVASKGFSQAGPFVVDPYRPFWERYFAGALDRGSSNKRYDGDNDFTNAKFKGEAPLLSGFLALLVSEWIPGHHTDGRLMYGWWGKYFNYTSQEVYDEALGVHFVAEHKPWYRTLDYIQQFSHDKAYPQLKAVYEEWWSIRDKVCKVRLGSSLTKLGQQESSEPQKLTGSKGEVGGALGMQGHHHAGSSVTQTQKGHRQQQSGFGKPRTGGSVVLKLAQGIL